MMQPIRPELVQEMLDALKGEPVYLHLEMTTGAYANKRNQSMLTASAFITNAEVRYSQGSIAGQGPYRIGLKTETGWVYAQGLTHWEEQEKDRIIAAGHDDEGKLVVAFQLSKQPF